MALARPVHSPEFRSRRTQNWLVLGLTYAAMYMARYNFPLANKALSDAYGWDKAQIGAIISTATLVYGLSALFNGPIADRFGGRRAMLVGAFGAFVFNVLFGLGAYLHLLGTGPLLLGYFATAWTLNMYFQSYSALALIKVNAGWFHVTERGVFSAIFGSMIQSGRFLVFLLLALPFVLALPWQWRFFIPAGIVAIMGVFTFFVVRDTPPDAGLEPFDPQDATSSDTEKMIDALRGMEMETPIGPIVWRGLDHQSTMGAYVGKIANKNGKGVMVDWKFAPGDQYLPSFEQIKGWRKE